MFDVITIGTATRDAFVKSRDFFVEKERHLVGGRELAIPLGAKVEVEKIVFTTGGGATNSAVTFARQGLKTAVIAVVGDDVSGRAVLEDLRNEHVHTGFIRKDKRAATAYSILLHPKGGERTVLVYRGAAELLRAVDIDWSRMKTRWFYLSSLAGNIRLLQQVISFAGRKKIKVAYNPGGKELKQRGALIPLLRHVDVLIANRDEASLITGIHFRNIDKVFRKWDILSPGINVMTDARNGVWVSDGRRLYRGGTYKEKKIVDRTGAGDAFGAGFVAGLIQKIRQGSFASLEELPPDVISYAIRLGSANATAKIEGIGAKYGLLTVREFVRQKRWRSFPLRTKTL